MSWSLKLFQILVCVLKCTGDMFFWVKAEFSGRVYLQVLPRGSSVSLMCKQKGPQNTCDYCDKFYVKILLERKDKREGTQ